MVTPLASRLGGELDEPRHGVLAMHSHFREPGEMVDAGGRVFHRLERRVQRAGQVGMDLAHAVAKADHVGPGCFADRAADGRHGVAVVEKERRGARSSTLSAIFTIGGIMRSARELPPGMTVSPTG